MTVSSTATTDYSVDAIIGLAMVTAGILHPKHYPNSVPTAELVVGRIWLFMKLQTMQSSGVVLRARDKAEQALVVGQAYVDASADTLSVEDNIIVRHGDGVTDRGVELYDEARFQAIPDKSVSGTPLFVYPEQQATGLWRLRLWPVPDGEVTKIIYPRTRRLKDVEAGNVTLDLNPKMYLTVMTWLAMRFAASKGRKDSAASLSGESAAEQSVAESDETDRGGVRFVVDDGL